MPLPQTIMGTAHRYSLRRNHGLDWALFQSGHALSKLQFLFCFVLICSISFGLCDLYYIGAALLLVSCHSGSAVAAPFPCFAVSVGIGYYEFRTVRTEPFLWLYVISGGFVNIIFMHLRSLSCSEFLHNGFERHYSDSLNTERLRFHIDIFHTLVLGVEPYHFGFIIGKVSF